MRPLCFALMGLLLTVPLQAQPPAKKRAATGEVFWATKVDGVRYRWSDRDLTATIDLGGKPLYSVARALKKEFGKPDPDAGNAEYEVSFAPLSVVGSLLSYERDDYWTGGAHPSGNESFVTIDVRKPGRAVKLTDLFDAKDIRQALLSDSIVQHVLTREKIAPPPTLAGLLKALAIKEFGGEEDSTYCFPENMLSDFAFHHIENGKVAVRFLMPHGAEIYRFQNTQIGILLPIPSRWKTAMTQAASGRSGVMMPGLASARKNHQSTLVLQGHP